MTGTRLALAKPLRSEIWEFDLNPKKGREQKGRRPCLVVSNDALNRSDFGTVIICPITTSDRPGFRWRVGFDPADLRVTASDWEPRRHWVATDQIVTVDTEARALRHLATVTNDVKLRQVEESLRLLLAL